MYLMFEKLLRKIVCHIRLFNLSFSISGKNMSHMRSLFGHGWYSIPFHIAVYQPGSKKQQFDISGGNFVQTNIGGASTHKNVDSTIATGCFFVVVVVVFGEA